MQGEVLEPPGRSRANQAGYRRGQPGYRRDQAGYPRDQAGYPRDQPGNPSDQPRYPRDQPRYPRDQAGYPSDQPRYPRDQPRYPRDQPRDPRYPRDQPQYPRDPADYPRDPRYPRDQSRYPRDPAGYPRDPRDQPGLGGRMPEDDAGGARRMFGWGRYPARTGVLIVLAAALLGVGFTVATHRDPGLALGIFVAGGTALAGISVRPRSAYAIIPVPALTYAAAAGIAGFMHDHATDTSHTALALSAAQWFADGFPAMAVTTALAVLIAIARWLLGRLRQRSTPSDLARPHQPARRATPGRPPGYERPDREDSSRAGMTNFRQPGAAPPPARPSRRRPPPPW